MVNLELYKVFYSVAKHGSLTKAAEELYISQPAVSQAIKQLETQLGTPLFHRKHRGMELTAQGGELIFGNVEKALGLLESAENTLTELNESATGTLRIGASETIFQYALSEKIVRFQKLYPRVKIDLISDISPKIIEAIKDDRCDVGFLNLPIPPDDGILLNGSIMYLNDIFIAGQQFSELQGKSLTLSDLKHLPLLLLEERTVAREAFNHYAASHNVTLQPSVEIDSWGFMKRLVAAGMGIGCIPREYTLQELSDGSLFELDLTPSMPVRSVGVAFRKNAKMPYSLRMFMKLFET